MHTRRHALLITAAALVAPAAARACEPEWAALHPGVQLAQAARSQIGVTLRYDAGYRRIAYPGGDLPRELGACTDVVVRAYRDAWGVDLQRLVHEDMRLAPAAYADVAVGVEPDPSIDHRRVKHLEVFLRRRGAELWRTPEARRIGGAAFPKRLEAGDLLTWRGLWTGGPHIAVVGEADGPVTVIQNKGAGAREDWLGAAWLDRAVGHFRWRPAQP
jgi:uncharacterized protein YijF (DUF1287 family)